MCTHMWRPRELLEAQGGGRGDCLLIITFNTLGKLSIINKMVILEAKLNENRISVHKIRIFVVKMCKNGLRILEAKFSCGGHQTFSAGMSETSRIIS